MRLKFLMIDVTYWFGFCFCISAMYFPDRVMTRHYIWLCIPRYKSGRLALTKYQTWVLVWFWGDVCLTTPRATRDGSRKHLEENSCTCISRKLEPPLNVVIVRRSLGVWKLRAPRNSPISRKPRRLCPVRTVAHDVRHVWERESFEHSSLKNRNWSSVYSEHNRSHHEMFDE